MEKQDRTSRYLVLQINDALFPIGAYSHSYGLETYIQKDLVSTPGTAWELIENRMLYGFCYNEFLSAKLAYQAAKAGDLQEILRIEEILEAARIPKETRDAGNKLGSRFVKTMEKLDLSYASDIFKQYCESRKQKTTTHSIVYGVFCASVGISMQEAMETYLYAQASSMVTNCVKTIPLSQSDGQKLLVRCHALFDQIMEKLDELTEDSLCLSMPGFDIRSIQHETLYSRIYMS